MDIFQLPGFAGWPGMLLALVGMGVYVHFMTKYTKSKLSVDAEEKAKKAKNDAIEAMQTHLDILRERVKDTESENAKLRQLFETMNAALKSRGLYVAVDGDMVHVQDTSGGSTTIHINQQPTS